MVEDEGYTRSYRRRWRNPVFRNLRDAGVWAWLTDAAAWRDTTTRFADRLVKLERGQVITSERFLAEGFSVDRQVIRRLLRDLESNQMITQQKTHGGTVITICNYDRYQALHDSENPPTNPRQTHVEPTANPNKKEDNEVKKGRSSDANASALSSAASEPFEEEPLKKRIFGPALEWLTKASKKADEKVRPEVGKWCSLYGDGATLEAMQNAARAGPVEPIAWIERELRKRGKKHEQADKAEAERSASRVAGAVARIEPRPG